MPDAKEATFSLKVLINKEKTKVLFAEADTDFLDVVLSFLTLPLGKIVKILEKHYGDKTPAVGSLTTLYNGLANPTIGHLWTELGQQVLHNPMSKYQNGYLKVNVDDTKPRSDLGMPYDGTYITNNASFIICDDLRVVPNVAGSIMQTLCNLGFAITDMEGTEIRNVTFGFKEVMDLLKGSLISRTPLADILVDEKELDFDIAMFEPEILMDRIEIDGKSNSKKMILKVMLQKSTKKLLFAQAEDDFVDFLFSILIIPLGKVEWLLGSNTCLTNIDNLYKSVADLSNERYMRTQNVKKSLIKPELPGYYISKHFLPLYDHEEKDHSFSNIKRSFVTGPRMYMVTDDLTVTPLGVSSSLCLLKEMNVSLSDVEELEVHIALEEALSILKASLTSSAALTHGLINPMLKKQQEQEYCFPSKKQRKHEC